jgi:stage II sporulation protein D
VSFPNVQALEFVCIGRRACSRPVFVAVFMFLIVLAAGCGKHKVQVRAPLPPPPSTTPAKQTEPPKKQETPVSPQVAVREKTVQDVVSQIPAPPPENAPGPLIRIGLVTDAKEIRISSSKDFYIVEKIPESPQQLVRGEIQARVEREDEKSNVYRIQVATFVNLDLAAKLKKRLSELYDQPTEVHENAAGFKQVLVGEFDTREEAQSFLKKVVRLGYSDAFIVKEDAESKGDRIALALRGPEKLFRLSEAGFLFQPSSRAVFISVNGKPYRGSIDISLNKSGRITVINQLGTEEYLLGVVPAEISPSSYPEFAALAAQSIAARTNALYALKNSTKYNAEGFDLTNDTNTQVYEGVTAERDLTSDAVRKTSGFAIYYQDKLINAMFMSTCGGRTEDFSNVFDSAPVPYLRSVFCSIESGPDKGVTVLQGKHDLVQTILSDDGSVANRNIEFARILGIIEAGGEMSPEFLSAPAERAEIVSWVRNAAKIAQKTQPGVSDPDPDLRTRSGFVEYAAEVFFGSAEIKRKISPKDVEYYMGNLKDGSSIPEAVRITLSYLMQSGLWRPYPDNTARPKEPVRRGDALSLLLHWVEHARPEILRKGAFISAGAANGEDGAKASINVKWGNRNQEFRLSQPYLFRLDSGRITPVSELRIIGNEKLYFHVSASGTIDFMEIELNPTGASSDRYSPVASWDITLSRSAISEKLRGLAGNIGELKDLKPYKTGNSGRAVQIQVIGSRSSVVLNGYKVRNALKLRDTLFTITREFDPDGGIANFTFHGRGWGHGIGLCQVGAFGMARAGHSYEEIIKTYYQGVEIRKAY